VHVPACADARAAAETATRAGELLLAVRDRGGEPAAMKDAGDRASQECLRIDTTSSTPDEAATALVERLRVMGIVA
jgi:hypothetical protein